MVMEESHLDLLFERFGGELGSTPVHVLDIPDDYRCMDPALIEALEVAAAPLLKRHLEERSRDDPSTS